MLKKDIRYYSSRYVKKRGKHDGRDWYWSPFFPFRKSKELDPPIDQESPAEFEGELIAGANENISRIVQKWSEIDKKLHSNCKNAEDKYKSAKATIEHESENHLEAIKKYEESK
ncbi:MAG: hypothetical protein ACUVUQ_10035 [Thermodesulfovibrionales bacterium]